MIVLTHFDAPVSEPVNSQIMRMVVDQLTELSMMDLTPSNLLYNIYQYTLGYEVHLYLEALGGTQGIAVELIVATDEQAPDTITGFVLYLPVKDDPQACGIAYMAERSSHHGQGVTRALLQAVIARYPHTELTCSVRRVADFEAMGLHILGTRGPQVVMNTRDHSTDGLMGVLDVSAVYSSTEVRQIHTYLLNRHGKKAMIDAEKKRDRQIDQLTAKARAFVAERLSQ